MPLETAPIVVTHCGARFGYNVAQSLVAAGYSVFAAAPTVPTMCKWIDGVRSEIVLPDAFFDPDGYVTKINALAEREGRVVLLPTHEDIFPAAEMRHRFSDKVRVLAPELKSMLAIHDKYNLSRLAADEDVSCPETRLLDGLESINVALAEWKDTVILKPRFGEGSNGIHKISDTADLNRKVKLIELLNKKDYLLQRFTPGIGVGVGCLIKDGRLIATSQHIRLREVPISGGTSTARATFDRPVLTEVSAAILRKANLNGIAMLEYRYDRYCGSFKLLDANPRYWGSLANHIRSGVDFPRLHVEAFLESKCVPEKTITPDRHVKTRWLLGEARAMAELIAARRFQDAFAILRRSTGTEVVIEEFSRGNLKPFLVQLQTYIRRGLASRKGKNINEIKRRYFSTLFANGKFPQGPSQ